jgi:hypothetical protein
MSETTVYTDFRLHAKHLAETGERSPAEVAVRERCTPLRRAAR